MIELETYKTCTKCNMELPLECFSVRSNRNQQKKYRPECNGCRKASRNRRFRNRDRNSDLLRRFGITLAEYNAMLDTQGGTCKICGSAENCRKHCNPNSSEKMSFPVDHDHETGRVRGILCDSCNKGIGMFKDNATLLRAAAAYLEELSNAGR